MCTCYLQQILQLIRRTMSYVLKTRFSFVPQLLRVIVRVRVTVFIDAYALCNQYLNKHVLL